MDIACDTVVTDANDNTWHLTTLVATLEAEPEAGIQMSVVFKGLQEKPRAELTHLGLQQCCEEKSQTTNYLPVPL